MKDILSQRNRSVLERFVGRGEPEPVLLAFDYDGTLAPLVRDPKGAVLPARTRRLLADVSRRYPVAVVSGRSYADASRFVDGCVPIVVGNHGFELGSARPVPAAIVRAVRGWREALERDLAGVPGIFFEDKRSTLAVHYGLARRWRASERAVRAAAARLEGVRTIAGKKVLNVLPARFPTKGDAVLRLLRSMRLRAALYAGDDVTDEDAFAVGPPRVLGVRVGPGRTRAEWRLRDQGEMDTLLELLLELRPARLVSGRLAR